MPLDHPPIEILDVFLAGTLEPQEARPLVLVEAAADEAARAQALTRDAALYFRRAWRRALPFPGRQPSPPGERR